MTAAVMRGRGSFWPDRAGGTPRAIEHSGSFLVIPTNMPANVFLQSRAAHKSGVETTFSLLPFGLI